MRKLSARLMVLLALCVALAMGYSGFRNFSQGLAFQSVRDELGSWGRDGHRPGAAAEQATADRLEHLLGQSPDQPDFLQGRASLLAWRAYWALEPDARAALNQQALHAQQRSLEQRPAHRHGWSKMLEYAARTRTGGPQMQLAAERLELLQVPPAGTD